MAPESFLSGTTTTTTNAATTKTTDEKEDYEAVKTWKNGSTSEPVYADTGCKTKIGSLDPYESCDCLGMAGQMYIVRYLVDGTTTYKVGVVTYRGGV
jgi:hypothetical protein